MAAAGGVGEALRPLYEASNPGEGFEALRRLLPSWVPVTTAVGACIAYYSSYRFRMLLSKWRKNARARLINKYSQQIVSLSPSPARPCGTDSLIHNVDPTAVTEEDLEEIHMSLGLIFPRDADLMDKVDQVYVTDPIPEGWILFRSTNGFLRFREVNTEELRFFHPGAQEVEKSVRAGVTARNQADIDFHFGSVSRGASTSGTTATADNQTDVFHEPNVRFESRINDDEENEEGFGKLLSFFIKKEKAKLEVEIQESFRPSRTKRSSTRASLSRRQCVSGSLTPSLRVTTELPTPVQRQTQPPLAPAPAVSREQSFQGQHSLPPRRPPTPRSSGTFERVPSTLGVAPRTPSFRAPPRTPMTSSTLSTPRESRTQS